MEEKEMGQEQELDQESVDVEEDVGFDDITDFEPEEESAPKDSQVDEEEEPEHEAEPEPVESIVESEPVVEDSPDSEPDAVDELDALRKQNEALLAHIENLSGQVIGGKLPVDSPAKQPSAEESPAPQIPKSDSGIINFLENVTIDDLLEDPSQFNNVLNTVAQRSTDVAVQGAVQQVMRSVPELVMGYITRHSAMNRMVDDFYRENSDLANVKQTVAAVANDIHAKNPDLGVDEVFKRSAEQTRTLLGLKKQAMKATQTRATKPAFVKSGSTRKPAPQIDPIQREINDLLSGEF